MEGAAYLALLITAGSAYKANEASRESAKEQKEANKVKTASQKAADLAAVRQKAREARIRRAQILANAENAGVAGSSGETGAVAGVTQNFGIQTAFQAGQSSASSAISGHLNEAAKYEADANKWQMIGSIANSVFGATGGSMFDSPTTKQTPPTSVGSGGGGGTPSWNK